MSPECANCSSHVSDRYRRVFAANDGTLHACSNCRDQWAMFRGAGVGDPLDLDE